MILVNMGDVVLRGNKLTLGEELTEILYTFKKICPMYYKLLT